METKVCTLCKRELPLDRFTKKKGRPGQNAVYKSRCKDCINRLSREVYYPAYDRTTKQPKSTVDVTDPSKIEKQCRDCGISKPLTEFHPCCKNPIKPWHWQTYCKPCDAARHRQKTAEGYERPEPDLALRLLEGKLKNVVGDYFQGSESSKALPFSLTVAYLRTLLASKTVNGVLHCAATGGPLKPDEKNHPLSPSIDRIDNEKGYIEGNVRIVALWYNLARRKWDDQTMLDSLKATWPSLTL